MTLSPTANMSLQKPEPSVTAGPSWAQMLNDLIDKLDAHDHSAGKGKRVTPSGMDINADLSFGSNNADALRSTRFDNQTAVLSTPLDVRSVYVKDGNLYYNNASGAAVQITSGAAIASSISGAFSAQAPASYPYTVSAGDAQRVLLVDTGASRTINLPAATTAVLFCIKDTTGQASTNPIEVVPDGTDTIDGVAATRELVDDYAWYFLVSDGVSAWSVATCRDRAIPAGSINMYGGASAPAGWLLCDGTAVAQATYPDLYAAIGTNFNTGGEGAGNFRLPDMRQRFPLGKAASGTGSTLGGSGGAIDHTHSVPAHYHGMGTGADLAVSASGAHTHTINHDHAAVTSSSDGAHTHSIDHNHAAVTSGAGGAHYHFVANNDLSSTSPSSSNYLARSYDATNDFSYDVKGSGTTADRLKTSSESSHTHSVDLPNFTGTSGSGGAHTHSVDVAAYSGSSASNTHTHAAGDFSGRIGLVTGGVNGNAAMTSGAQNPPFLALNFIIKT